MGLLDKLRSSPSTILQKKTVNAAIVHPNPLRKSQTRTALIYVTRPLELHIKKTQARIAPRKYSVTLFGEELEQSFLFMESLMDRIALDQEGKRSFVTVLQSLVEEHFPDKELYTSDGVNHDLLHRPIRRSSKAVHTIALAAKRGAIAQLLYRDSNGFYHGHRVRVHKIQGETFSASHFRGHRRYRFNKVAWASIEWREQKYVQPLHEPMFEVTYTSAKKGEKVIFTFGVRGPKGQLIEGKRWAVSRRDSVVQISPEVYDGVHDQGNQRNRLS